MNYIFNLLPAWLQALIRPEVDDLIGGFNKLEAKLVTVVTRHTGAHVDLHEAKRFIETEIAAVEHEIERAKRIADRIRALTA